MVPRLVTKAVVGQLYKSAAPFKATRTIHTIKVPTDMARNKGWRGGKRSVDAAGADRTLNRKKTKNAKLSNGSLKTEGSHDEVLLFDVNKLLATMPTDQLAEPQPYSAPEKFSEIEITVSEISSTGDGLALSEDSNHVYVVPFTAPGDVVKAKIIRNQERERYTITDFISVVKPSPLRDDSRIQCPYFAKCSGCQFQMMDYAEQLKHKKTILERAYKNFSDLAQECIPHIGDTIGSPLQYNYRTKLTPHFDGPRNARKLRRTSEAPQWDEVPPIGFMVKNTRRTLDIEDCPIGTPAVRQGIKDERARVAKEIQKYKRGATLLLRESTTREPVPDAPASSPQFTDTKYAETDQNATSTEYVDDYIFTNPAGSFFQNNNSILPTFTQYIRSHILGPPSSDPSKPPITHLLDAYSGSGLFTITLSPLFKTSTGIDISPQSIDYASRNAELNKLSNTSFKAATASTIFDGLNVEPDETAVVIDPPRKGCDEQFLKLLLKFGPRRVVYVSCNVHTQARDVGWLVEGGYVSGKGNEVSETGKEDVAVVGNGEKEEDDLEEGKESASEGKEALQVENKGKKRRYRIESLRGFDFFPQTGHVEGVAVLERADE